MEPRGYKEVYFDNFCALCKHKNLDENLEPCNECLSYGAREGSHKPLNFKEAEHEKDTKKRHTM